MDVPAIGTRCFVLLLFLLLVPHTDAYADRRLIPPYKVVVSNENYVEDVWVVKEVRFFFGQCHESRNVPIGSADLYFSSGVRFGDTETLPEKAFDGSSKTYYGAYCGGVGGCFQHQAYIGVDITATAEYQAAATGTSAQALVDSEVNCIRFMGSSTPRHKSNSVSVLEVVPGSQVGSNEEWVFRTHATYDVAGDVWSSRPAEMNVLWRIMNAAPTENRWGVTELKLFEDAFCTMEVAGAVISSGLHSLIDSDNAVPSAHGQIMPTSLCMTWSCTRG